MDLKKAVRKAAIDAGIDGIMELTKRCGLSYERTKKVWDGEPSCKIMDVEKVLNCLGRTVTYVKVLDQA